MDGILVSYLDVCLYYSYENVQLHANLLFYLNDAQNSEAILFCTVFLNMAVKLTGVSSHQIKLPQCLKESKDLS